jgi:two-component system nitrogen regulation response regulator GlnG
VGRIEAAHLGTLFLDEISNIPPAAQAKLLRVLQENTLYRLGCAKPIQVDARMLSACSQDLQALCERGAFRTDLYFRLNEYTITIPALRERREDIPYLAKRFMDIANVELSKSVQGFSPPAIEAMLSYRWPGNVRQLRSVVRRAVLMADDMVTEENLGLKTRARELPAKDELTETAWSSSFDGEGCDFSLRGVVQGNKVCVERMAIICALRRTAGNKAQAARLLQVDYKTLHSKVKEYGIQIERQ